jgi:threonine synthase
MKYISTRGKADIKNFKDVVTSGLARDGGLYVPEKMPNFSTEEINSWKNLPYNELAFKIFKPFVDGEITDLDLKNIIDKSYKKFRVDGVIKNIKLEDGIYVMELFQGPTLAFKDVALQFLGNLQDFLLSQQNRNIVIIGATSGDTGSAAIEGIKDCKHVKLFMLHPHNRVSKIQRYQMTTVVSDNIFNIAMEGSFDDCQEMVKDMFKDQSFMHGTELSAVNSINWARILAQIVYYFKTYFEVAENGEKVSFSVPSGNFGDVLAGYLAKKMGLNIDKLIVATNKNDILHRLLTNNDYSKKGVSPTVAPSMDIQISSNLERLLFFEYSNDTTAICQLMDNFKNSGSMKVADVVFKNITKTFLSCSADDGQIKEEIKRMHNTYDYVVCPHTATGTLAAEKYKDLGKIVVLATAHPAKFPDVVNEAINIHPALPEHLKDLLSRQEKYTTMPNDINKIKDYIYSNSKN